MGCQLTWWWETILWVIPRTITHNREFPNSATLQQCSYLTILRSSAGFPKTIILTWGFTPTVSLTGRLWRVTAAGYQVIFSPIFIWVRPARTLNVLGAIERRTNNHIFILIALRLLTVMWIVVKYSYLKKFVAHFWLLRAFVPYYANL